MAETHRFCDNFVLLMCSITHRLHSSPGTASAQNWCIIDTDEQALAVHDHTSVKGNHSMVQVCSATTYGMPSFFQWPNLDGLKSVVCSQVVDMSQACPNV